VANKGTRIISQLLPLNVLNPSLLSMGNQLNDQFQSGQTTLDGVSIPYSGWVNQMQQCPATVAQALLPYPQFCGNLGNLGENAGNTTFHSLQVKAEKRYSHGLWMLTSYTLSKFISSGSDIQASVFQWGGPNGVLSPFERKRNKSLDNQDVPQTLSLALMYQLPVGKGQRYMSRGGIVNKLVGGWQLASIFRIQSAIPLYFSTSNCNVPGQFYASCIPAVLAGMSPFAQNKSGFDPSKPFFNHDAFEGKFVDPVSGAVSYGVFNFQTGHGSRVSNYRGFGFHNHDISLQKTTSISERVKFQFRAEAFNLWNWHIFSNGTVWLAESAAFNTDLASPAFGTATGATTGPRNFQLGAKFIF